VYNKLCITFEKCLNKAFFYAHICVYYVNNLNIVTQTKKVYNGEMLQKTLTQKQKIVYDFIVQSLEKSSVSPTIAEIAAFLGVSSLRTVTQYLESLEKKGFIRRGKNQSRGIKIIGWGDLVSATVTLPIISAAGCDNLSVFAEQAHNEFQSVGRFHD
jgi:predicted DNA-binding transcriptional regulator